MGRVFYRDVDRSWIHGEIAAVGMDRDGEGLAGVEDSMGLCGSRRNMTDVAGAAVMLGSGHQ